MVHTPCQRGGVPIYASECASVSLSCITWPFTAASQRNKNLFWIQPEILSQRTAAAAEKGTRRRRCWERSAPAVIKPKHYNIALRLAQLHVNSEAFLDYGRYDDGWSSLAPLNYAPSFMQAPLCEFYSRGAAHKLWKNDSFAGIKSVLSHLAGLIFNAGARPEACLPAPLISFASKTFQARGGNDLAASDRRLRRVGLIIKRTLHRAKPLN